jgi:transcriptional accessory protein Tex/SPT6
MPQGVERPVGVEQHSTAPRGELGHLDLSRIAQDLQIRKVQVEAVVQLLDEGNTIPFITRYRKERTGGLDEDVLRTIQERVGLLRQLADRKQTILRTIENQGKLTDELRAAIIGADNPKRLEDLYLPYKPKKRSLAATAREKGLEPLAVAVWAAEPGIAESLERLNEVLPTLLNPEQGLNSTDDVMQGVGHILAELIAETADVRAVVRQVLWDTGKLQTSKSEKLAEGQGLEYKDYFNFTEPIRQIPPHRVLAINRGEKDNALSAKLDWDAATGRRVAVERLPLPKKEEPRPVVEPPPPPVAEATAGEGTTAEGTTAETPAPPPVPPTHAHAPHHHHHRGPRGQLPPVNRTEDLQKHPHHDFIEKVIDDALGRLLVPSLEREIRRELTQKAESHAVVVFARNLRSTRPSAPAANCRC